MDPRIVTNKIICAVAAGVVLGGAIVAGALWVVSAYEWHLLRVSQGKEMMEKMAL
jgi:hypothetical protein